MLYAVGGLLSKQGVENHGVAVIERYCPSTNRWTVLPTRLSPRYGFAACAAGDYIYIVGGLSEDGTRVAEVDRYNVLSGECDKMPDLPTPRAYLSAVVYEGQMCVSASMSRWLLVLAGVALRASVPCWAFSSAHPALESDRMTLSLYSS